MSITPRNGCQNSMEQSYKIARYIRSEIQGFSDCKGKPEDEIIFFSSSLNPYQNPTKTGFYLECLWPLFRSMTVLRLRTPFGALLLAKADEIKRIDLLFNSIKVPLQLKKCRDEGTSFGYCYMIKAFDGKELANPEYLSVVPKDFPIRASNQWREFLASIPRQGNSQDLNSESNKKLN